MFVFELKWSDDHEPSAFAFEVNLYFYCVLVTGHAQLCRPYYRILIALSLPSSRRARGQRLPATAQRREWSIPGAAECRLSLPQCLFANAARDGDAVRHDSADGVELLQALARRVVRVVARQQQVAQVGRLGRDGPHRVVDAERRHLDTQHDVAEGRGVGPPQVELHGGGQLDAKGPEHAARLRRHAHRHLADEPDQLEVLEHPHGGQHVEVLLVHLEGGDA